jgi:non-heme chloroperoxidase
MFSQVTATHSADAVLANGIRLRYLEAGDPAGHPVIMPHGYSDSSFSFSPIIPLLGAEYRLFALDQRGHGDSDRPEGGYRMSDFAADVVAFMDALELPRATLVGHSMGTFVALEVALSAPQRVAGLALIDSAPAAGTPTLLEVDALVAPLRDPVPLDFVREFQASTAYEPLPSDFLDQVVAESLKLPARVWQAAMAGLIAADNRDRLGQIQAPVLLLWGEQDGMFVRADQEALLAGLAQATLTTYPDTGHAPHWERPAQVAQDLRGFLRKVGGA